MKATSCISIAARLNDVIGCGVKLGWYQWQKGQGFFNGGGSPGRVREQARSTPAASVTETACWGLSWSRKVGERIFVKSYSK